MAFPSTFKNIQDEVIKKARLQSADDLPNVKDWINEAYAQAVLETESYVTSATMTLTSSTSSYTLPAGVLRIKEMFVTPVGSVATAPIEQVTLDTILRWRAGNSGVAVSNGTVTQYALLGSTEFEVYPTPGAADVVTIYYVALPTALSADADLPSVLDEPYASKLLKFGALAEAADFKKDPDVMLYRSLYEDWLKRLRSHLARKSGGQTKQFDLYPVYQTRPHDPSIDLGY